MDRDAALTLLRSSTLGARLAAIEPHLTPSLRLRASRDASAGERVVSRFAGKGVLPRGAPWPTWDDRPLRRRWVAWHEEGIASGVGSGESRRRRIDELMAGMDDNPKPIDFLAILRLADVAPHAPALGLPDRGALLFFFDVERNRGVFWPEARGVGAVLYAEDEGDLVVVPSPPVARADFHPAALSFEVEYCLPDDIAEATGERDLSCHANDEYRRVQDALRPFGRADPTLHALGGPPAEVQHGLFRSCQLVSNGVSCGSPEETKRQAERVAELLPGVNDWRLLLQIDSDEDGPGWMWGDCGRLYYCVHRDDLAARRFERAWCDEQGH